MNTDYVSLAKAVLALHRPVDEEAEFWADGDEDAHDARFPLCARQPERCEGHTATIQVCSECGYAHDGEIPVYRTWPCPTALLMKELLLRSDRICLAISPAGYLCTEPVAHDGDHVARGATDSAVAASWADFLDASGGAASA